MTVSEPPDADPTHETIIRSSWPDGPTIIEDDGAQELALIGEDAYDSLIDSLKSLVSAKYLDSLKSDERRTAIILHQALSASPLIHKLQDSLWIEDTSRWTNSAWSCSEPLADSNRAATTLLRLAASARLGPGSYPLVPHRLHILTRPTDGLIVCLNQNCSGPDNLRLNQLGAVAAGYGEVCEYCECATLSLYRCDNCGEWLLAGRERNWMFTPEARKSRETKLLSVSPSSNSKDIVYIDPATGEIRESSTAYIPLEETSQCPNCEAGREGIGPFSSGTPLPLSLAAETLLSEMPEFPAAGMGSNSWLPAGGRRLLSFSDSRREAARLGILLTNQHELQVVRSAILEVIESSGIGDPGTLDYRRREIERLKNSLSDPALPLNVRQEQEDDLNRARERLTQLTAGGSIELWAGRLEKHQAISQLLDRPSSTVHKAASWKQLRWEDNAKEVRKRTVQFLGKEFARVMGRDTTLEALGLVEVTYPGLEGMECPPQFIGKLPTESMRRPIRESWTDILTFLCDTLRANGAITLGEELDDEHNFNQGPMGLWAFSDQ